MPETQLPLPDPATLPPPLPEDHRPESPYPDFTCPECTTVLSGEPSCHDCNSCVFCCRCEYCERCNRRRVGFCNSCHLCSGGETPCCRCWECDSCHNRRPQRVARCPRCAFCVGYCCRCWQCTNCQHWLNTGEDSACPNCSRCLDCCACEGGLRFLNPRRPTFHVVVVGTQDQRPEDQRQAPPMSLLMTNGSKRFISTEIEVSGTRAGNRRVAKVISKWKGAIVRDGSLPEGGFEINTAPAAGDVFIAEIEEICAALKEDGAFVDNRAGAHVHVDARDFTFYDIRRLVFLYEKIEPGVFGLVPPSRQSSSYCHPCGPVYTRNLEKGLVPKENKARILKNLYNINKADKGFVAVKGQKYNDKRYNALNLHSWMYRGTVECRIMHGSVDPEKLVNWGVLWAHILDYAYKNTENAIRTLTKKPIDILLDIAPTDELKMWIENRWAFFHRTRR